MRAISLVNRVEYQNRGNVMKNGISIGDVDNDGHNEFVVGSENGNVAVFKGRECIQVIPGLGFITAVVIGDIFNEKRNCLVAITGDGWCYIFDTVVEIVSDTVEVHTAVTKETDDVEKDKTEDCVDGPLLSHESSDHTEDGTTNSDTVESEPSLSYPQWIKVFSQRIPANTKDALLEDIDGDGSVELVLGLTDRVVRSYRWCPNHPPSAATATSTGTDLNRTSSDSDDGLHDKQKRKRRRYRYRRRSGRLICQNKWECARQVGSLSLQTLADGTPALMVAQPGGTFMRIRSLCEDSVVNVSARLAGCGVKDDAPGDGDKDIGEGERDVEKSIESTSTTSENLTGSAIDYQFLNVAHMRNPNISTEILGNLRSKTVHNETEDTAKDDKLPYPYVVATLDGTIMLVRDEVVLKTVSVDQQIFVLDKLDVTGDGADNILACTWSGHTYILDQHMDCILFELGESIQTFKSGRFTLDVDNVDVTCFIYVTYYDKILLYYDVPLKEINCKCYEISDDHVNRLVSVSTADGDKLQLARQLNARDKHELIQYLLYSVKKG